MSKYPFELDLVVCVNGVAIVDKDERARFTVEVVDDVEVEFDNENPFEVDGWWGVLCARESACAFPLFSFFLFEHTHTHTHTQTHVHTYTRV